MRLLDWLNNTPKQQSQRDIQSLEDYASVMANFTFGGLGYGPVMGLNYPSITQTLVGTETELASNNFVGLAVSAYAANGVVFACMAVRQLIFSSVRFRWQRLRDGHPSDTFSTPDLGILDRPWPGGTTQDLLVRMIQDVDLGGNAYLTVVDGELVRLRPDWVDIAVQARDLQDGRGQVGWRKAGYVYTEGGSQSGEKPVGFYPNEVVHFHPTPDPLATYRGMSWLTPVLREIQADQSMTRHQRKFFDQGATPNMVVKHAAGADEAKIKRFAEVMADKFGGVENAYKTLHLYPGADATVVGANLKDIDFKQVRGGGETRIAAAAGVPPIIVGLSEGLESATYSNYSQARRRLADGTAHPLWQNLAGSLEVLFSKPRPVRGDVRLWYDASDVPFLREDEKDAADIAATRAQTISSYITAGFEPDSVVAAVEANDLGLLTHTGLFSVQLQPAGLPEPPPAEAMLPPAEAMPAIEAPAKRNGAHRSL